MFSDRLAASRSDRAGFLCDRLHPAFGQNVYEYDTNETE